MITAPAFAGKSYAVLGLARAGMAAVETLLASGARVTAWDRQEGPRRALRGQTEVADLMHADFDHFDGLVIPPRVALETHPVAQKARAAGVPMIGDIELFALARRDLPPHRVVGITGTNGKSTTAALLNHLLETAGVPSALGGTAGLPILAHDPLPEGAVYVLDLSSYQIDLIGSLACEAAALTNVTPDHLERYDDFADYAFSMARLFALQSSTAFAVFGSRDAATVAVEESEAFRRPPGCTLYCEADALAARQGRWPGLQGSHNLQNAAIAAALATELGVGGEAIERGLRSFGGLPHRMERLGEFGGVLFVNDSKATNPASTAPALAAFPPRPDGRRRIHWICGGLPRSDELDECAPAFGNVAAAYTIGEAGQMFAHILAPHMQVEKCEMLCEAASRAVAAALPGDVVLLSPACASIDQFRDYEMRGDDFRRIVAALTGSQGDKALGEVLQGRSAA